MTKPPLSPAPLAPQKPVQLAIAGTGLAGLAASIFAVNRGLSVARIGSTGGLAFTTGYLDLLGLPDSADNDFYTDPFKALAVLRDKHPAHPYALVSDQDIENAFSEFLASLAEAGLPYSHLEQNSRSVSPMGTEKCTYALPETMMPGVRAFAQGAPCLVVDFAGLKAFSARQLAANLAKSWPTLRPLTIAFPDLHWSGELYPEAMARCLEVPATREALAQSIKPHLGDVAYVGLPAVLGIHNSHVVQRELSRLLGVTVFEIPTLPPAVPGIRLRESIDESLRGKGLALFAQRYIFAVQHAANGFTMHIGESRPDMSIQADAFILATGRFLSGGLRSCRELGISEPLLNLPVKAPADRDAWHNPEYFAPQGHAINRAGIVVDRYFRPVDTGGTCINPKLFAIGAIVAGQDWVREKSGAGIALVSAWKAVNAYANHTSNKGAL